MQMMGALPASGRSIHNRRHLSLTVGALLSLALLTAACTDDGGADPTSATTTTGATTTTAATTIPTDLGPVLFLDSDASLPPDPNAARERPVKVDLSVLLRDNGRATGIEEFTVNLFPDVTYTAVITEVNPDGNGYTWIGYLKDVEYSNLTMVYTGSAFIAQFASPAGVYEVSLAGDDLYRVVLIDQAGFPGEG